MACESTRRADDAQAAESRGYPGTIQYVGSPLGLTANDLAYAGMTQDDGPLTAVSIGAAYRILNTDTEAVRKTKAYSWITKKVMVMLTDGVPNVWSSSTATIGSYMTANPDANYYDPLYPWYNSVLMQTDHDKMYPVGMGIGCDYDFMDRLARLAKTDIAGQSMHGGTNPAQYEDRMVEIFKTIINTRGGKLVK